MNPPMRNVIPITLQLNASPIPDVPNVSPYSSAWDVPLLPPTSNSVSTQDMMPAHQSYMTTAVMSKDEWFKVVYRVFLKGKPLALGIVLVVSGVLQVALAIPLYFLVFTVSFLSGVHFWGAIFHITAGSLSIVATKKQSLCSIKSSLGLCIVSSLSGIAGFCLTMADTLIINGSQYSVDTEYKTAGLLLVTILIFLNVLVVCVSFSLAVFGCCAVHNPLSTGPPTFVIQTDVVSPAAAPNLPSKAPE